MWCRLLTIALFFAALGNVAGAQTTQPAGEWHGAIIRLGEALQGNDLGALNRVLRPAVVIRTFTSDTLQTPQRLLGATTGATVLAVHAYLTIPSTLASDISNDFKTADVPEAVRRDFVIPDVAQERDANEIAARWISHALQPAAESVIGVIVLWRQERSDTFQHSAARRPIFLLIKGEIVDGQYVFQQITFGDPLDRPR